MGKALSAMLAAATALALAAPVRAEDANLACAHWHADPAPGYSGPLPAGLICEHARGPTVTWTVPAEAATTRFSVYGADDSGSEARGGRVEATLSLTPGSTLTLEMGGEGAASAVKLGDEPLIVAGGGDGVEPNFASPSAKEVETEEPGAPLTGNVGDGWIWVEWSRYVDGGDLSDPPTGERPQPPTAQEALNCVVPKLKGLRPIAARNLLAGANCALGKVTRRPSRPGHRGRITRQFPHPGTSHPPGAPIGVVVGRRP